MPTALRNGVVLSGVAVLFCVAFLIEPEWYQREAHNPCTGQVFESLDACDAAPGCTCSRPLNPWVITYWLMFLSGLGMAAALLLRAKSLLSAIFLAGAMTVGGYGGLFLVSRREMFEPEAWAYAPFVFTIYIAVTLLAFFVVRLARHLIVKRQPAT
jgi:hypothetical protein